MITGTVWLGKDNWDRIAMAGQSGLKIEDRTVRAKQEGQPEHESKDCRAGNKTAGTE